MSTIVPGEIRHVSRTPQSLMKVVGPYDMEAFESDGTVVPLNSYLLTYEFPKHHYVIILGEIDSYIDPGNKFYVAKLITHSSDYDNLKISEDLYEKESATINLEESYVTRDLFLIAEADLQSDKMYGKFNLEKLEQASEY